MTKQLKVDSVVNVAGTGKPNFPVSPTSGGAALSTLNTHSYTSSATEPSSPKNGAIWWDSANSKVYVYANGEFKEITLNTDYPSPYSSFNWGGDRAVSLFTAAQFDYFDIATSGNAADFGDKSGLGNYYHAGNVSNGSRLIWSGGYSVNVIEYLTSSTTGNATDFGDLTRNRWNHAGASNNTRGLFMGGDAGAFSTGASVDIEYITIASAGNGTDHGDLTVARRYLAGSSNGTYAAGIAGQYPDTSTYYNVVDRTTIDTTANATDHGDLTYSPMFPGAFGNDSRTVVVGGQTPSIVNNMDSIDLSTSGNATDYGDLTVARRDGGCTGNATHGVYIGGNGSNVIDRWSMSSSGNAVDHGDLTGSYSYGQSASGAAS